MYSKNGQKWSYNCHTFVRFISDTSLAAGLQVTQELFIVLDVYKFEHRFNVNGHAALVDMVGTNHNKVLTQ